MTQESKHTDLVTSIPANLMNTRQIPLYTGDTKKVRSYAGHVNVPSLEDESYDANHLFYWFFESQQCSPHVAVEAQKELIEKTPILVWLNGGPGASSLLGLFLENGPFRIEDNDTATIDANPFSWNQQAHVIYWDQPLGTGYTYSDTGEYVKNERELGRMFCLALKGFFERHPEYVSCPLYITGESYAGKYVPYIATEIDRFNDTGGIPHLNLKGIAVGDGWMKPEVAIAEMIEYVYTTGLIGTHQRKLLRKEYRRFQRVLTHDKEKATDLGNAIVAQVLAYGGNFDIYDVRRWQDLSLGCLKIYLNSDPVKRSLHVPTSVTWQCADNAGPVAENLKADNMADCTPLFSRLLRNPAQYRLLFYTGNFDPVCGYLSTEKILYDLDKWKDPEDDKAWATVDRKIWALAQGNPKGFIKQYKNLTQVSIPGAGHEVPWYKPMICREMLYDWLFERDVPGYVPESREQTQHDEVLGSREGVAARLEARAD